MSSKARLYDRLFAAEVLGDAQELGRIVRLLPRAGKLVLDAFAASWIAAGGNRKPLHDGFASLDLRVPRELPPDPDASPTLFLEATLQRDAAAGWTARTGREDEALVERAGVLLHLFDRLGEGRYGRPMGTVPAGFPHSRWALQLWPFLELAGEEVVTGPIASVGVALGEDFRPVVRPDGSPPLAVVALGGKNFTDEQRRYHEHLGLLFSRLFLEGLAEANGAPERVVRSRQPAIAPLLRAVGILAGRPVGRAGLLLGGPYHELSSGARVGAGEVA